MWIKSTRAPVHFHFHPTEMAFPIQISDATFDPVSVEVSLGEGNYTYRDKDYFAQSIAVTYDVNYGIGCGGTFLTRNVPWCGYHPDDLETIVFLFEDDPRDHDDGYHPTWVYFAAHGGNQGEWRTWDECDVTDNHSLNVYVARYSHAHYGRRGSYVRAFGFANDHTVADRHVRYMTLVDDRHEFNASKWTRNSMSRTERFFLPFSRWGNFVPWFKNLFRPRPSRS